MMNKEILLLNGSPRGEKSNTLMAGRALVEGMKEASGRTCREIELGRLRIEPCRGCFGCWRATPGKCVIQDDMREIYEAYDRADTVVVCFPVYFFGLPGSVKTALDRMLPVMLEYDGGTELHRVREQYKGKRYLFVSTCGFQSCDGIYDALRAQLRGVFGPQTPPLITVPQAELMGSEPFAPIVNERLAFLREIGRRFAADELTEEMIKKAASRLIPIWSYNRIVSSKDLFSAQT